MKIRGKVHSIDYLLYKSRSCRNITVRVLPGGTVRIGAPVSASRRQVEEVLVDHERRILELLEKERDRVHRWEDGEQFLLEGNVHVLHIFEGTENTIDVQDGQFLLVHTGSRPDAYRIRQLILDIYRGYGTVRIERLIRYWAPRLGVPEPPFRLRDTRKRWGSCSAKGMLSFSLRAAALDDDDLSYLVLHEMAHLVHFDHGRAFHALLDTQMPDWKNHQEHMFSLQRETDLSWNPG